MPGANVRLYRPSLAESGSSVVMASDRTLTSALASYAEDSEAPTLDVIGVNMWQRPGAKGSITAVLKSVHGARS